MLGEIPPSIVEQCFIDVHQLHRWTAQQAVANLAGFGMLVPTVEECDDFIENVRRRRQGGQLCGEASPCCTAASWYWSSAASNAMT